MLTLINSSYFKDLLESFSYGVVIFNAKEQAYAVNTIATRMLGRSPQECVGESPGSLFGSMDHLEAIQAMLHACRQEGACPKPVDTVCLSPEGVKLHLSLAASLLIENNKIFGILISMHDNTHIYQLHEREKRIIEQNNRLQRERAESLLQLSRAMAHQIRNPVMSIGGFAKLIQRKVEKGGELDEFATAVLESSQRLEGMVKAFTRFTGIRPGAVDEVDLALLLRSAAENAQRIIQERGLSATLETRSQECVVSVDPALVLQAVEQLVCNSLEAGSDTVLLRTRPCPGDEPEEEEALVQAPAAVATAPSLPEGLAGQQNPPHNAAGDEGYCCLEVEDTGPGIDEENMPFLFDPFFSTKPESAGMGLCIVQRTAQELGGSLRLMNRKQGGLVARLSLPRPRKG